MSDGSVTIEVTLSKEQLEKGLQGLKSSINSSLPTASSMLNGIGSAFEKLGSIATSVGKTASVVTAGVTGILTASFNKAKSFIGTYESAMSVFTKKLDGGSDSAKQLYNSLLDVAKGSTFSQEYIISAGQTLVAMGLDANKTTKYVQIATDAIAGMGGSGSDIQNLTETFGKMSMQTTLYSEDLNQLAMQGIPVFDILATKYGTTRDAIKDMASKGLLPAKESLETLSDALETTDKSSQYFQYSIAGVAQSLKNGSLTGVIDSLNSSFRSFALSLLDLDPREASGEANIKKLSTTLSAFGSIMEDIGKKFSFVGDWIGNFLDKLVTVTTKTDEAGNVVKVYGGYLGDLKNKLDSLSPTTLEAIGKAILGIAIAGPTLLITGKAFNFIGGALKGLSGAVGGISNIIKAISVVTTGATASSSAVSGLASAFTVLTGPVGIVLAIITAVIAVLVILYNKSEKFRNAVNDGIEKIKEALSKAWEKIKPSFEKLGETLGKLLEKLAPVGDFLLNVLVVAIIAIVNILTVLIDIISNVVVVVTDFINNLITFFTETLPSAWSQLITNLQNIWTTITTALSNFWNSIVTFFTEGIPSFIQSIIDWITQLPYNIGYQIGLLLGYIIKFGQDAWNWITNELPKIIWGIINWFAELPRKYMELAS